jgi:hypothetical protein
MMAFYHYTCAHRADQIRQAGYLVPMPQPLFAGEKLVWLTDLDIPERRGLGLTSYTLDCDRTEFRVVIRQPDVVLPWMAVRNSYPPELRLALEGAAGAMPRHWYLSAHRQRVAEVDHLRPIEASALLRSGLPTAIPGSRSSRATSSWDSI